MGMNEKITSKANNWSKKLCIIFMRNAKIKKASQDEQQNQTTTININYIKKI